jgi:hypothetical protein
MKFLLSALIFMAPVFSEARTITLRPGDQITVDEDDAVVVKCEKGGGGKKDNAENPRCHTFHSDDSCRGLTIGTVCEISDKKKGECISDGIFDGAPNCKCK